jgi:hypothetical protein
VLRAAGRVFWGLGSPSDPVASDVPGPEEHDPELDYSHERVPLTMTIPALALAVGGLVFGLIPGLADSASAAAAGFVDRARYAAAVLGGASHHFTAPSVSPSGADWAYGALSALLAVGLAGLALYRERTGGRLLVIAEGATAAVLFRLRRLHTGDVADYVTWLVVGTAVLGGLFAATLSG